MPTLNEARQSLHNIMFEAWEAPDGTKYPLQFVNSKPNYDENDVDFFCHFSVIHSDEQVESYYGYRDAVYRRFGTAIADIYIKKGEGNKQADDLSEIVMNAFRNQTRDPDIVVTRVSTSEFGQTEKGMRYEVSIFFWYEVE